MNLHILHSTKNRTTNTHSFLSELCQVDPEQGHYVKGYGRVTMRPIRPDDESRMIRFHESLSEESVYLRYFEHISLDTRTLHERLARVCANTADSFAVVAERGGTKERPAEIVAVGRLTTTEIPGAAAFAILVGDEVQNTLLSRSLLKRLISIARAHDFHTLNGELLVADHDTLNLCRAFGFNLHTVPEDGIVRVSCPL